MTFVPLDLADAGRYTRALNELGIRTLSAPEWTSINAVIESLAPQSDILLLYRGWVAADLFDLARRSAPRARILFHPVDLHFLRMQRQADLTGDRAQAEVAQGMRVVELDLIGRADATIVVSTRELALLKELLPAAKVHQIPILRDTPRRPPGARLRDAFRHLRRRGRAALGREPDRDQGPEQRRDLMFIGGFEHSPNVDAVLWFVRAVWPKLLAKGFSDRFIIVGSKVPEEIVKLASDRIEVRGHVEELAPLFAACRLSVAPLRYGGGIKGKIVTSLSLGVPVVATSIAAEGMGLRHDDNILVADDADDMADQIVRLYDDADLWQRLSASGYRAFRDNFSLNAGAGKVLAVLDGLMDGAER